MSSVIGVVGGSGGVGASSFAAALAVMSGRSLLVDLDASSGGIDVALGIESVPGVRWSGLHVGGGRLDPDDLFERLPRWGPVSVLAADLPELDADATRQVLTSGQRAGPVVVDVPRARSAERTAAFACCDLVLVVARADVSGLVAAHAVVSALPDVARGLVVRRSSVPGPDAAALVGCPLLGALPPLDRSPFELDPYRLPRAFARVAGGVLHGLAGLSLDAAA